MVCYQSPETTQFRNCTLYSAIAFLQVSVIPLHILSFQVHTVYMSRIHTLSQNVLKPRSMRSFMAGGKRSCAPMRRRLGSCWTDFPRDLCQCVGKGISLNLSRRGRNANPDQGYPLIPPLPCISFSLFWVFFFNWKWGNLDDRKMTGW